MTEYAYVVFAAHTDNCALDAVSVCKTVERANEEVSRLLDGVYEVAFFEDVEIKE